MAAMQVHSQNKIPNSNNANAEILLRPESSTCKSSTKFFSAMIRRLSLRCHSLSSSASGYTLPLENTTNSSTTAKPDGHNGRNGRHNRHHSFFETVLDDKDKCGTSSKELSNIVSCYDPFVHDRKTSEILLHDDEAVIELPLGESHLCYSDDDSTDFAVGLNLCQEPNCFSLNEGSTLSDKTYPNEKQIDQVLQEDTHMSWAEIMIKKHEIEENLKYQLNGIETTSDNACSSYLRQEKKCKNSVSLFSQSFKLKDLFSSNNSKVRSKKTRKSKKAVRSTHSLGMVTPEVCGHMPQRVIISSPTNDRSPVLFDLKTRGLPAIPFGDCRNSLSSLHDPDDDDETSTLQHNNEVFINEESQTRNSVSSNEVFIDSFNELKNKGWYWGPLSWKEAEEQLKDKSVGSFLVRDSSDDRYILSLSFKSEDQIHHTRIEHYRGQFSFNTQPKSLGAATIVEFIEKAVENCADGSFSYFLRPRGPGIPPTMVRLVQPVSRFNRVHSLQHLCRFVILSKIRRDMIERLPIPSLMKKYLACSQYYVEEA